MPDMPEELTDEMLAAALLSREKQDPDVNDPWWMADWLERKLPDIYKAMVEARPARS